MFVDTNKRSPILRKDRCVGRYDSNLLIAVAPTVGVARIVSAAPELALAIGYDIDSALERFDEGNRP